MNCQKKIKKHMKLHLKNENGELPERISSSALNSWLFNEDTIKKALHILMTEGIRINYGENIRKDHYLC